LTRKTCDGDVDDLYRAVSDLKNSPVALKLKQLISNTGERRIGRKLPGGCPSHLQKAEFRLVVRSAGNSDMKGGGL